MKRKFRNSKVVCSSKTLVQKQTIRQFYNKKQVISFLAQRVFKCRKRRLLDTHQWQFALLVVGLPVTHD